MTTPESTPPVTDTKSADEAVKGETESFRSIVVGSYGGSKYVRIEQQPVKQVIESAEIEVKVDACGVNFQDIMVRQGFVDQIVKPPFTMGSECAGTITRIGAGVTGHKVGDRVVLLVEYGAWAERLVVRVDATSEDDKELNSTNQSATSVGQSIVLPWPSGLNNGQAACMAYAYLPAYYLLHQLAHVQPGAVVMVYSAGGGVGTAIGQLVKQIKNVQLIGIASKHKHEKLTPLFQLLGSPDEDYIAEIRKAYPKGVDVILDCLGGDEMGKSEGLLKPLGKYVQYGMSNMVTGDRKSILNLAKHWLHIERINPLRLCEENRLLAGFSLRHLLFPPHSASSDCRQTVHSVWTELCRLVASKQIDPWVDSEWSFEEVKQAMSRLQERKNVGKIILNPNRKPEQENTNDKDSLTEKDVK